jgi:hypothetical protein
MGGYGGAGDGSTPCVAYPSSGNEGK